MLSGRIAILTNFIPPYRIPLLQALADRVQALRLFISAEMEEGRGWYPEFGRLSVHIQRSISVRRRWVHPHGFTEYTKVHFPYDTLFCLRRFRPDVIISGELGFRTLLACLYRTVYRKSRLIVWATVSEYTEMRRGWLRRVVRGRVLQLADAVIVNGASGARYIRSFGVVESRILRIPQTTDTDLFTPATPARSSTGARRLLFVGRLVPLKGIHDFVQALARWAIDHEATEIELCVVGEGPERERILDVPRPPNLVVKLIGHRPYRDLPAFYGQADMLVFPTLADEWGLVVNEALAAGLPVLGSRYSQAVEELIEDGQNGWVYQPDRVDDLRNLLDRVLTLQPEELEAIRRRARASVLGLTPVAISELIARAIMQVAAS